MIISPIKGPRMLLEDPDLRKNFTTLSGLPARKKWQGRQLIFTICGAAIDFLEEHFPHARYINGAEVFVDEYNTKKGVAQKAATMKREDVIIPAGFNFKTQPFNHQLKALQLSADREAYALFHEQGLGKTKVILDNAAYLYEKGLIDALVVIAPNGVHSNWIAEEAPVHCYCPWTGHVFYSSMSKRKANAFKEAAEHRNEDALQIFAFSIESVITDKCQQAISTILLSKRVLVVIDESQRIKDPRAQRTKLLLKIRPHCDYRRIMTGTPVTRGVQDLFSQFAFLDPDITGHKSFSAFKAEFCEMGGFEMKQIIGYCNIAKLQERIDGWSHRARKIECLDLPPKVYQRLNFNMSGEQEALYKQMKKDFWMELDGQRVEADMAMTRILRLQQVACGWFPDEQGMRSISKSNTRFNAVMEMLDCMDGQIIFSTRFRPDVDLLMSTFGKDAVRYDGTVQKEARTDAIRAFQSGDKRFFIANVGALIGITLTAASFHIFYANDFSLEKRMQAEDRSHRSGQKNTVTYIDVQANNTVDRHIINCLRSHREVADEVMQDPESFFLGEDEP